jgi:septal ring factor EnvC (AmiA/AmiB activator)
MRLTFCLVIGMTISFPMFAQPDVRIVNGIAVNLEPLHKWFVHADGQERPLKHWKRVSVEEIKETVTGLQRCKVKIENDSDTEVLVANLPSEVSEFEQTLKQKKAVIADLEARIQTAEKRSEELSAASGRPVRQTRQVRQEARRTTEQIQALKADLTSERTKYSELARKSDERSTFLAMFTGQSYMNLQIWDCGRRKAKN